MAKSDLWEVLMDMALMGAYFPNNPKGINMTFMDYVSYVMKVT